MMKNIYPFILRSLLLPLLVLSTVAAQAQYKISGTVIGDKDRPIRGVSVSLDNTIDGGTTDSLGIFTFTTEEKGNQTIVATMMGYDNVGQPIVIEGDMSGIVLRMRSNKARTLDEVTITAGSFDASNDKSKTVLRPLDIVTTAGANADVVKAIQMLPGTQQTGPDNGLFVRGGDASEASIIVDEMVVQNAFIGGAPGVGTRSRFGAFNYQGVSFSSGGYSARYGQALSSVLELNTTDLPDKSNVNLGINMAGLYASGTKKWKKSSLDIGGNYTNTTPFFGLAKTNMDFYRKPVGGSGNLRYVWTPNKDGILKVSLNGSYNTSGVAILNPFNNVPSAYNLIGDSTSDNVNFLTKDQYYYSNVSYKQMWKAKYMLYTAASYSLDKTDNSFGNQPIDQQDHRAQFRIEGKDYFTGRMNLLVGMEVQSYGIEKSAFTSTPFALNQQFTETQISGYTELEWTPVNRVAVKPGARYEHSVLLNTDKIAPRFSMAYKTSASSQVSFASGIFYQNADNMYLVTGLKPGMQSATHYILNWQYAKNDRTLRLEGYYKNYADLIKEVYNRYNPMTYRIIMDSTTVNNSGYGYAQGFELFYRDKKTVKNLDYWITYSYIDTRRIYANYNTLATPTFIADHNLNIVGKYFVDKWHTNISATYSFATGRPYYNANFEMGRTPDFHNLALSFAYLQTFGRWFTVFYVSLDNVTNQKNVFGYRFDATGVNRQGEIKPPLYRSIFFGVNMSLTQFKKDEL